MSSAVEQVMRTLDITCLFLDIGGVLLTDGWNYQQRKTAIDYFALDAEDFERRHHLAADTWEIGKMTMEEYVNLVVFHQPRSFIRQKFTEFMFGQSKPHYDLISLISDLKHRHGLKIIAVNNESFELNRHRITKFRLSEFIDFFISSGIVHLRKPDTDIFKLALEGAHVAAENVLFIDNKPLHCEVAAGLGLHSIVHTDCESTGLKLKAFGLGIGEASQRMAGSRLGHVTH